MRVVFTVATLVLAGCLGGPAPDNATAPAPSSPAPGTANTTTPAPAAANATGPPARLAECAGASTVEGKDTLTVAAVSAPTITYAIPPPRCGKATAILNGTLSGDVGITWEGGEGGCHGLTVIPPATITCWEEGLPWGNVNFVVALNGAGTVDLLVESYARS